MNPTLLPGLVLLCAGGIYLLTIPKRNGERFEYAAAMFFMELGLMFVVSEVLDLGRFTLPVTLTFGVGLAWTATVWWKLFSEFRRKN